MTQMERSAFVHRCYETAYARQADTAFLPSVPPEMRTGLTNAQGWFQWKLIPAPTRAEDLDGGGDRAALLEISQTVAENLKIYAEQLFLQ